MKFSRFGFTGRRDPGMHLPRLGRNARLNLPRLGLGARLDRHRSGVSPRFELPRLRRNTRLNMSRLGLGARLDPARLPGTIAGPGWVAFPGSTRRCGGSFWICCVIWGVRGMVALAGNAVTARPRPVGPPRAGPGE